jgi:N4-gp56 family major capsid protein
MAVVRAADIANQVPQIWAADLFAQAENLTFWHAWEGPPGSSMPIVRRDELTAQDGDTIKLDIVMSLTGAGQTGDTTAVEGNEEQLKFRQISMTVEALSHGVRWTKKGKILIDHDMRTIAEAQLAKWLAGKMDDSVFNELSGNGATTMPTLNKYAMGSATSRATIADGNTTGRLTLSGITEIKAYAQADRKIEPIKTMDGNEWFGMVIHPYAAMSLKRDDTSWAQAQRDAQLRGSDNPLFTGAVGVWDGVILYVNNRVPNSTNGSVNTADNVFFGAQALARAYAYYPDWTEEYFDYGREQGIATYVIKGDKLITFDLTTAGGAAASAFTGIGAMVVYSAAVAPTVP